jgi:hypothetical protein
VPAVIVAISGASILFIALFLARDRRDYALKAADRAFATVRALIGHKDESESSDDHPHG